MRSAALASAGLATAGLCVATLPAAAETVDFCVRCTGPEQTYRCKVSGVSASYSDAVKLFCVMKTSKEGGHKRCSASRKANCAGIEKVYNYDGPPIDDLLSANPQLREYKQRLSREQQKFPDPEDADKRKSLMDLGKGMVGASKKGIDNAKARFGYGADGSALPEQGAAYAPSPAAPQRPSAAPPSASTSAMMQHAPQAAPEDSESWAGRSYRCMRSFFRNCGSEDKNAQ
ncbi:hypothetical protein V6C03_12240 [Methyloligella sp. 2.7D]|uniref:hypothetical protein n=1 Tax=unclassified Methyloligella TaxID=2625955 RepID=UPI00157CA0E1|nr:hypothetical protein [Methyloligella sp. GL2]QKP77437.1 hypothetical protein HT051_08220 [Methyloligella sp. GL2]